MLTAIQSPAVIPLLETARLRLHGHRLDDIGAMQDLWSDPAVTRHTTGRPSTPEETWSRLCRYPGHWALMGYGFWAIEEKSTGRFIGEIGFADFRREIQPPLGDEPEAGWVLSSSFHGRGYATEALTEALAWGESQFGGCGIQCIIHPENASSIQLAKKFGFQEIRRAKYKNDETLVLRRAPRSNS